MPTLISSDRKKKHHLFGLNFKEHVRAFMNSHHLIHPNKTIVISVSGGVDSLALVDVISSFGVNFELLHFNHGTRPAENLLEENKIRDLGHELGVKVNVFHFDISLLDSNFEKRARDLRKNIYNQFIKNNYWVYTAHHIDDSFEWSLMQSFKQSGMSTLGIPVFNNGLVRPFMCASKKQILRYARARKLHWVEDPSNLNEKFERNFMRLHLTSKILKRYPSTLAHYVSRNNQLALIQNVHRLNSDSKSVVTQEISGGYLLVADDFKNHKNEIKEIIFKLSSADRGEINNELDKLIKAQNEIKNNPASFPFKGPMNFSGGVQLFLIKDHLFLTNNFLLEFYQVLDFKLCSHLQSLSQIPESALILAFPKIVISFRKKLSKSSKYSHPLLPVTCEWLRKRGISYGFIPLMSTKNRQMLAKNAVILDSSVMGL
jgi:tRNA(Ile)-lysidine synthase